MATPAVTPQSQMSMADFAGKIKSAYPGTYDQLDDHELANRVLAKFPVYRQHVNMAAIPATPQPSLRDRLTSPIDPGADEFDQKHPIIGKPVRAMSALGGAVLGLPKNIYHAATDPITPEETNEFKGHTRIPGELALERMSGGPLVRGAKQWADPKTRPTMGQTESVLPEALGIGAGNYVGSELGARGLPRVAGKVAPPIVRGVATGANKVLSNAPGTLGGGIGAALGHSTGLPGAGEVGAAIGYGVGREVLPKLRVPGERFGLKTSPAGVSSVRNTSTPEAPPGSSAGSNTDTTLGTSANGGSVPQNPAPVNIGKPSWTPPRAQSTWPPPGSPADLAETKDIAASVRDQSSRELGALRAKGNEEGYARNTRQGPTKGQLTGTATRPVKYTKTPGVKVSGTTPPATGSDELLPLLEKSLELAKKAKGR